MGPTETRIETPTETRKEKLEREGFNEIINHIQTNIIEKYIDNLLDRFKSFKTTGTYDTDPNLENVRTLETSLGSLKTELENKENYNKIDEIIENKLDDIKENYDNIVD